MRGLVFPIFSEMTEFLSLHKLFRIIQSPWREKKVLCVDVHCMCIFMSVCVSVSVCAREKRRRYPCGGMIADSEGCTRSWQNLICDEPFIPCRCTLQNRSVKRMRGRGGGRGAYMLCIVTLSIVGDDAKGELSDENAGI